MKNELAILFSGGTDSTLAAALMAEKFEKIHLITYDRFGFFASDNTKLNVLKLQDKFGQDRFIHHIIKIDKITKWIFYERYLYNLKKHKFFVLSICGLCKLAMHLRTVIYCLDNGINNVCDGANKGMNVFPAQMKEVLLMIKDMYAQFGINYINPVFNFEEPQDSSFYDRLGFEKIFDSFKKDDSYYEKKKNTTGYKLFELGLMPSDNVKGSKLDRSMQSRCFQLVLFNVFALSYYIPTYGSKKYQEKTVEFCKDKINVCLIRLREYINEKNKSKLFCLIE